MPHARWQRRTADPRYGRSSGGGMRAGQPGNGGAEAVQAGLDGLTRQWDAPFPVDLRLVLGVHRRGPQDPAFRTDEAGSIWRTTRTPDGPATIRVRARREPARSAA